MVPRVRSNRYLVRYIVRYDIMRTAICRCLQIKPFFLPNDIRTPSVCTVEIRLWELAAEITLEYCCCGEVSHRKGDSGGVPPEAKNERDSHQFPSQSDF